MELKERVEQLEKEVAAMKEQVSKQLTAEAITNKIKTTLAKEIKASFEREFALDCDTHTAL